MNEPVQITIIEDNQAYAKSLQQVIDCTPGMKFRHLFNSAELFAEYLTRKEIETTDLILLDLHLPGKNGLTLVPSIQNALPDTKILILTQNDDYLTTLEAIRLGVHGYILKSSAISDIRSAIYDVHDGGYIIDQRLSGLLLHTLTAEDDSENRMLSERESQALKLMAMGYVKKEVAEQMGVSYRTVAQYTERIYSKLQVPNIAAAIATAIRKGLI
ncbi:response regulator transcription factor [Pontiella agarivorans]|uniref:Response regulator transcription factor n=1 Tax=Pontiella agarivorans TaxID=3038953 RepID=A0ABU5MTM2_9BACT|nr:response regulator transcription factor [Pontiella agarivorans]MDZ8117565.1 response regulator transcription factor [Pontiella agarivorans]